jgi:hypothetical protein
VPLAFWLMGAQKTITIDLNPYLKAELIKESLQYISDNNDEIRKLFGSLLREKRMDDLLDFSRSGSFLTRAFLDLCCIQYVAPGDAAATALPPKSIDFHTSYTVLEHIQPDVLKKILVEGNRIMRDNGLFIHGIDYSDHFAHSDKTMSPINFLRFSDEQWERYAGNRYMYMNRLRHDDFLELFQSVGHRILTNQPTIDARSLELLKAATFPLSERFRGTSKEILATCSAWLVTQKDK